MTRERSWWPRQMPKRGLGLSTHTTFLRFSTVSRQNSGFPGPLLINRPSKSAEEKKKKKKATDWSGVKQSIKHGHLLKSKSIFFFLVSPDLKSYNNDSKSLADRILDEKVINTA